MSEAIDQSPKTKWRWLRTLATLLVCIAILGGAAAAVVYINQTEPTAKKSNSARKSAALIETVVVERGTFSPTLTVLGTVRAAQDIVLSPRVSGPVIELSPKLTPGGMVTEGDLLLRIDPADFQNAISIRKSELSQAEASREIEQARQRLAEKELKMLEGSIGTTNRSLVMREPQIASIEAEVSAAEAAVERATLDLNRTSVRAPFDAQVISRSVDVGSQVGPNNELARLVGIEEYWIMAAVPVRSLRWVQFPEQEALKPGESPSQKATTETVSQEAPQTTAGSTVILRHPDVWGPGVERHARVARMIGTLDRQTRLAQVLIIVNDPLGQKSGEPPLILDSLLETEIECRPIADVVRLKRDYVRKGDTVWVMVDNKLQIRDADVVFRDAEFAYLSSGLETGDEVVTTTLATVAEGVGLRKITEANDSTAPTESDSPNESSPVTEPASETDASTGTVDETENLPVEPQPAKVLPPETDDENKANADATIKEQPKTEAKEWPSDSEEKSRDADDPESQEAVPESADEESESQETVE